MSRFMLVVPPFFGHISPNLSLGAELISRGHEVVWVGIRPLAEKHIPEGGQFLVPEEELADHQQEIDEILKKQDLGPTLSAFEVMKLALQETYIPFCRLMMPGMLRLVEEWQPDIIIHDELMFCAPLTAHIKNIPFITTIAVPPKVFNHSSEAMRMPKIEEWAMTQTLQLQRDFGVMGEEVKLRSEQLCLVSTSAQFTDAEGLASHFKFVGPLIKGRPSAVSFDWERLDASTKPKVYVTLGTLLVDIRKKFFTQLVETFADADITFVCATNPDIMEKWPDNFIVQSYVPQSEIIPKMDAVICHGGFNSVNETFYHGLPMLIIPIAYDQFYISSLVEKAGCGIPIRYKRLKASAMKEALYKILEEDTYKQAALKIQESLRACGGTEKAADYVESFAVRQVGVVEGV